MDSKQGDRPILLEGERERERGRERVGLETPFLLQRGSSRDCIIFSGNCVVASPSS